MSARFLYKDEPIAKAVYEAEHMGVNSPFHREVVYPVPVTPVMEVYTLSLHVVVNAQA